MEEKKGEKNSDRYRLSIISWKKVSRVSNVTHTTLFMSPPSVYIYSCLLVSHIYCCMYSFYSPPCLSSPTQPWHTTHLVATRLNGTSSEGHNRPTKYRKLC